MDTGGGWQALVTTLLIAAASIEGGYCYSCQQTAVTDSKTAQLFFVDLWDLVCGVQGHASVADSCTG